MVPTSKPGAARAEWTPRAEMKVLNTDLPRVDGPQKVTGRAVYPHDVRLPNMLYARLVLVPVPRAKLNGVDLEPARKVAGVVHVARVDPDKTEVKQQSADSVVAVVAAETPEAARDGARAVVLDFEELLPAMVTREQALDEDSPKIGRGGKNSGGYRGGGRAERADVEAAYEAAPHKAAGTFDIQIQHHVCLETHGVVVDYRGDSATVYPSTQMVTASAGMYGGMLGLPADKVQVICPVMGGGFGSKFGPGTEGRVACEVALAVKRPVHLLLDRPQEFLMAGNRSGTHAELKMAADAEGKLVSVLGEVDRLGGSGGGAFPGLPYIYDVAQASVVARSVYTATDSSRAMRAPGHPQGSFCMETLVDEVAYAGGFDPLELRIQNLSDPVYHRQLRRVADEIGWNTHPYRSKPGPNDGSVREGIGFAVGQWGSGGREGCEVETRIAPDGAVTASVGSQDLGTGLRTYVAAIPAEEFGLTLDQVTAKIGDSFLPPSVGSGGSVTTGSLAPACKASAHQAREAFEAKLEPTLGGKVGGYTWADGKVWVTADESKSLTWKQACALLGDEPLSVTAGFEGHLHQGGIHGAQAARVSVDTLTGHIQVLKMVQIQDVGIPLNRLALRSQMNGGMIQALSFALHEERIHDPDLGLMLTANLEDYKIAGSLEMPELVAIVDDDDTRQTVCGMAEASNIAGAGAIANAVFNACGIRLRSLPLTPDKVLTALGRT